MSHTFTYAAALLLTVVVALVTRRSKRALLWVGGAGVWAFGVAQLLPDRTDDAGDVITALLAPVWIALGVAIGAGVLSVLYLILAGGYRAWRTWRWDKQKLGTSARLVAPTRFSRPP